MDVSALMTGKNAMLPVAVFVISQTLKSLFPAFFAGKVGQRLMPVIPLVVGVGLALLGLCDAAHWQDRMLLGLLASFTASHLFKVGKTSFLGWGVEAAQDPGPTPAEAAIPPVTTDTKGK